jgi:hypothetical protein
MEAICECGFKSEFNVGGGFSNFRTADMEPAICPKCKKFLITNYMKKH